MEINRTDRKSKIIKRATEIKPNKMELNVSEMINKHNRWISRFVVHVAFKINLIHTRYFFLNQTIIEACIATTMKHVPETNRIKSDRQKCEIQHDSMVFWPAKNVKNPVEFVPIPKTQITQLLV